MLPRRAARLTPIQGILDETDWSVLDAWAIPARPVLEVARDVVLARAAQAEDDQNAAVAV